MKITISLKSRQESLSLLVPGGLYSSVKPSAGSVNKIAELYKAASYIEPKLDDAHVTVLFSRNENNVVEKTDSRDIYTATVKEFITWDGHDGKPYLVMLLDSPGLQAAFTDWIDLGYTVDFPEYRPHITVQKNLDPRTLKRALADLNNALKKKGTVKLYFGAQKMAPLKD